MTLLPIDELNVLTDKIAVHFEDGKIKSRRDCEDIIDELLDFFLLTYANGTAAANGDIGADEAPKTKEVERAVYKEVAGETWETRVRGYYKTGGTLYDIQRIAETDMTRIYNTAVLDTADRAKVPGTLKRWVTMQDDRVRDTHDYLEGVTIPYDAKFYTFDGDNAPAPGLFALPENNINCRCVIELLRA